MNEKNRQKQYKLLNKEDVKYWINLVLKVNQGYELDEKELRALGAGSMVFDVNKLPEDIKAMVKKAQIYCELNKR